MRVDTYFKHQQQYIDNGLRNKSKKRISPSQQLRNAEYLNILRDIDKNYKAGAFYDVNPRQIEKIVLDHEWYSTNLTEVQMYIR